MKVAIFTGSREWTGITQILTALDDYDRDTDIIMEGGHRVYETLGVPRNRDMFRTDVSLDAMTHTLASQMGFDVVTVWAPWTRLDRAAGPYRNATMLRMAIAMAQAEQRSGDGEVRVEAFPLPGSRGTINMVNQAHALGVSVREWEPTLLDG